MRNVVFSVLVLPATRSDAPSKNPPSISSANPGIPDEILLSDMGSESAPVSEVTRCMFNIAPNFLKKGRAR